MNDHSTIHDTIHSLRKVMHSKALLAGVASMLTVAILIVIKAVAYMNSGSVSVLASLVDSVVDASVSIMTFMAIRFSLKPADAEHRHGHGKIEGLAALGQAVFVLLAGAFLLVESFSQFGSTGEAQDHALVIAVMLVSVILSGALVAVQNHTLEHASSLAVEADKAHYSADIFINIGVIVVFAAIYMGAPAWIDPAFAIGVVAYLAFAVRDIAGKGFDMLLDRELPDQERAAIKAKVKAHPGVLGMHDLRAIRSGMRVFISFDIEADPALTLAQAHDIVRAVEHDLLADFPHAEIMIHVDPAGDTADTRHSTVGAPK